MGGAQQRDKVFHKLITVYDGSLLNPRGVDRIWLGWGWGSEAGRDGRGLGGHGSGWGGPGSGSCWVQVGVRGVVGRVGLGLERSGC